MARPPKPDKNNGWIDRFVSPFQGFLSLFQSNGGSHDSHEDVDKADDLPGRMQKLKDLLDESERHRKP